MAGKIASIVATAQVSQYYIYDWEKTCYTTWSQLSFDEYCQVESGNPGESKELRNAREKFNRVFGVSLGEEDRLVSFLEIYIFWWSVYMYIGELLFLHMLARSRACPRIHLSDGACPPCFLASSMHLMIDHTSFHPLKLWTLGDSSCLLRLHAGYRNEGIW